MVSGFAQQTMLGMRVRVNRRIFKKTTNSPYLSGDGFASLCDFSFDSPVKNNQRLSAKEIREVASIFCPSDKLEEMLHFYGDNLKAKVIIAGNGDRDFYNIKNIFPESVKKIYLQNSHISGGIYETLPIGVENLRFGRNGFTHLFDSKMSQIKKKDAILVGPFSPTHTERTELDDWYKIRDNRLFTMEGYLQSKRMSTISAEFKFIACPRGNGTDTHRFWETLYRGSIPVVKSSEWSKSIAELGIPVLQLKQWNFEEFICAKSEVEFPGFNPVELPILWLPYWKEIFTS